MTRFIVHYYVVGLIIQPKPPMRLINSTIIILLLAQLAFAAQWFQGTGHASLEQQSTEQARFKALWEARWDAVAQAGIAISGGSFSHTSETQGKINDFSETFTKLISQDAKGIIIQDSIIHEGIIELSGIAASKTYTYEVTIRAQVEADTGKSDPAFSFELSTDNDTYRNGESLVVTMTASKPCWVTLFSLCAGDTIQMLSPHPLWGNPRLEPSHNLEMPPAEFRARDVDFPVTLPPGRERSDEIILAVAVRDSSFSFDAKYLQHDKLEFHNYPNGFSKINRWILSIPRDQRIIKYTMYSVVKS